MSKEFDETSSLYSYSDGTLLSCILSYINKNDIMSAAIVPTHRGTNSAYKSPTAPQI
jgi:hypothetical protein